MSGNLLARYIWLVDTLRRARRLTRAEINRRWEDSALGNGNPMPRRTFYNYRAAVLELFGIEILFDSSTNEYYIDEGPEAAAAAASADSVTDLLLDSVAMSGMLADARSISSRIFLEQVPSARTNLPPLVSAIKESRAVRFSYHPYTRSIPTNGIILEPYLLKLFRQRWYVAGRNVAENRIKTYALDRISDTEVLPNGFTLPANFDPREYFRYSFGIVVDASAPRKVAIKADARRAKYLRALPLHPSQQEMVHDSFSIFHYDLLLTPDFLAELMSLGPDIEVLAPPELKTLLIDRLRQTLDQYKS